MKKILLVLICVFFANKAFAETGKNLNWCNSSEKIASPVYLTKVDGINKIVRFRKKLKNRLLTNKLIDLESDVLKPKSIYGLTKHASEMFIQEFSYAFGLKYIINRFGVVAGPLQFG